MQNLLQKKQNSGILEPVLLQSQDNELLQKSSYELRKWPEPHSVRGHITFESKCFYHLPKHEGISGPDEVHAAIIKPLVSMIVSPLKQMFIQYLSKGNCLEE